jgi:hypothetical protein
MAARDPVSITPGQTQLARTPLDPNSLATVLVKAATPDFITTYGNRAGWKARIE